MLNCPGQPYTARNWDNSMCRASHTAFFSMAWLEALCGLNWIGGPLLAREGCSQLNSSVQDHRASENSLRVPFH